MTRIPAMNFARGSCARPTHARSRRSPRTLRFVTGLPFVLEWWAMPGSGVPERIVIVGASLAGLWGAVTLRKEGFDGTLTIIGDETDPPYDRPPLSKQVLTGWVPPDHTFLPRLGPLGDPPCPLPPPTPTPARTATAV